VKKMTPKELKSYLREFKKSQEEPETKQEEEEEEEAKQKELPGKYPAQIGDKKAYYYCLICTEHIGSLKKWSRHQAQTVHRERLEETAAEARRKYNCADIDLQDCVISDAAFGGNPCAQCRECWCIFYTGEELAAHMSRGGCSVKAASQASSETVVQFGKRAASPAPAKEAKHFPKYLLNGKLAYYFCIVCNTTVGTLIDWHRHVESETHVGMRALYAGGQPEYQLLAHLRRGNPEHRCLICQVVFESNEALWRHFDGTPHQAEEQHRTDKDCNLMRMLGDRYPDLIHCDVCDKNTADTPDAHRASQEHQRALADSEECYFCPAQVRPDCLVKHIDSTHLEHIFQCLRCPTKYIAGEKILDHVVDEHMSFRPSTDQEIIMTGNFRIPPDLRKVECDSCSTCFLAQDLAAAKQHVQREHGEESNWGKYLNLGCRLCAAKFFTEEEFNEHSFKHYRHDEALIARAEQENQRNREQRIIRVKNTPSRSISPKLNSSRESLQQKVAVRKASKSPPAAYSRASAEAEYHRHAHGQDKMRSPRSREVKKTGSSVKTHLRSRSISPHSKVEKRRSRTRSPRPKHVHESTKERDHYWDREYVRQERAERVYHSETRRELADHHRSDRDYSRSSSNFDHSGRSSYEEANRYSHRKSGKYAENDYASKSDRHSSYSETKKREKSDIDHQQRNVQRSNSGSASLRDKSSLNTFKSGDKAKARRVASKSPSKSPISVGSDLETAAGAADISGPSPASQAIKQGVQQRIKDMLEEKVLAEMRAQEMANKQKKQAELLNKIKKKKQRTEDDLRKVIEIKSEAAAAAYDAAVVATTTAGTTATDLRRRIEERAKAAQPVDNRRVIEREYAIPLPAGPPPAINNAANVIVGRPAVRTVTMLDSRSEQVAKQATSSSSAECRQLCPICCTKFLSVDDLLVHFRMAHVSNMFSCLLCQRREQSSLGWTLDTLLQHLAESHDSMLTAAEAQKKEMLELPGMA
jgi:hypothetical protein